MIAEVLLAAQVRDRGRCVGVQIRHTLDRNLQVARRRRVEQWRGIAHAALISWSATKTPRRRKAAGACTSACARAPDVSNGNQKHRSLRAADHSGASFPSRIARCSASPAKSTSQRDNRRKTAPVRRALTSEDREDISRGLAKGLENKDIAVSIGRSESTAPGSGGGFEWSSQR